MAFRDRASDSHGGFLSFLVNLVLRFFQFVLALAVVGLYGGYLNDARLQHKYADPNYVYAVVTASLAALSGLVLVIPFFKLYRLWPWDVVIFILWVAVFGVFGKMWIHEDPEGDAGSQRMKNAVWVDLTNMILWFLTAVHGIVTWITHRGSRSLHTGRATV